MSTLHLAYRTHLRAENMRAGTRRGVRLLLSGCLALRATAMPWLDLADDPYSYDSLDFMPTEQYAAPAAILDDQTILVQLQVSAVGASMA